MSSDISDPHIKSILGASNYDQFKQSLASSGCKRCSALCQTRHHIVVDRGQPTSKIMLIGEAPGENEDLQGEAFVGRAGQLLDKMMAASGLDTKRDVFIVNVVKCRPPNNRAPTPQEVFNCRPYLNWQLAYVKPRIIVLLGATALKHMAPQFKTDAMKDLVGKFFSHIDYPQSQFLPLYHPAFLLRDPRKKPETWEHLKVLRRRIEEINSQESALLTV